MTKKHLSYLKSINMKNLESNLKKLKRPLRVGTDCSGIEAPIQALDLLNIPYEHIFSCDYDEIVRESIKGNYNPKYLYDDIFNRNYDELPKIDLYIAGFPCQAFSTLGKREGFEDEANRGVVFFGCYETIKKTEPDIFILENVKGLINHNEGDTFYKIIKWLKKLKIYDIYAEVLNTKNYGVPQNRERVYIIGLKKNKFNNFSYPKQVKLKINVTDVLENKTVDKKFAELTTHKKQLLKDLRENKRIDKLSNNWSVNLNVSNHLRCNPMLNITPTLLAGNGGDCIYYLTSIKRRYTPREYLRLQGFPDSFKQIVGNSKMYKQVGNSMSVNVLTHIYASIFDAMK